MNLASPNQYAKSNSNADELRKTKWLGTNNGSAIGLNQKLFTRDYQEITQGGVTGLLLIAFFIIDAKVAKSGEGENFRLI